MDWFKVSANYPDDVRIQKVGQDGEILFLRGCAWSALADTDGFIPETQLARFGLPRIATRVAKLVMIGLWEEVTGGYQIPNWFVWQSEAYAAERKRIKDRNRIAAKRAQDVVRQSHDSRGNVAPLEREEETTPPTPAKRGGVCDGTHDNCRGCGTTRRSQLKAAVTWRPPWCGQCDEKTRQINYDTDMPARCPRCHPAGRSGEVA